MDEALLVVHPVLAVVLAEGRIADDPVKAHQLATVPMAWVGERVVVLNICALDAVQEHVHLADGPDAAVVVLPVEAEVTRVATVLGDVVLGEDEHAARADAGVVDSHPRFQQLDHQADDVARGVELAALLAGRVGEDLIRYS